MKAARGDRRLQMPNPRTAPLGVILVAGLPTAQAIEAVGAGAFGYLLKPFNVSELVGTLERALAHHHENGDLLNARRQAQSLRTSNLRLQARLRRECLTSVQNLIRLGQNIIVSPNLRDAQAFGRLVQTESQGVLEVLDELIGEAEGGSAEG